MKTIRHSATVTLTLATVVAVLLGVVALQAQQREEPNVRFPAPAKREQQVTKTLSGQVVDAQKQPVAQAVVHLKNKKTAEVRTRIAGADGRFVIRGLDRDTDYEVHAEYQGSSSDSKTLSSFDDRDEMQVTLELKSGK
jgi:hypothetical protein